MVILLNILINLWLKISYIANIFCLMIRFIKIPADNANNANLEYFSYQYPKYLINVNICNLFYCPFYTPNMNHKICITNLGLST